MSKKQSNAVVSVGQTFTATTITRLQSNAVLVDLGGNQVAILRGSQAASARRMDELSVKGTSVSVEVLSVKKSDDKRREFDIEVSEKRYLENQVAQNLKPGSQCLGEVSLVKDDYLLVTVTDPAAQGKQGLLHASRVPGFDKDDFKVGDKIEVEVDSVEAPQHEGQQLRIRLKLSDAARQDRYKFVNERAVQVLTTGTLVSCILHRKAESYLLVRLASTIARGSFAILPLTFVERSKERREKFVSGLTEGDTIEGAEVLDCGIAEDGKLRISLTLTGQPDEPRQPNSSNQGSKQRFQFSTVSQPKSRFGSGNQAVVTAVVEKGFEVSFGVGGAMPGFLPNLNGLDLKVGDKVAVETDALAGLVLSNRVMVKLISVSAGEENAQSDKDELLSRAKKLKVQGANSRWGEETLRRHVREALK